MIYDYDNNSSSIKGLFFNSVNNEKKDFFAMLQLIKSPELAFSIQTSRLFRHPPVARGRKGTEHFLSPSNVRDTACMSRFCVAADVKAHFLGQPTRRKSSRSRPIYAFDILHFLKKEKLSECKRTCSRD